MSLTQDQVRDSPDIDTAKPVSRQYEREFYKYYWISPGIYEYGNKRDDTQNPHLRSTKEVIGYHILAKDGEIGHAEDFLFDDESWRIKYLLVDTSNWRLDKKVIVPPTLIRDIVWAERQIVVDLEREAIQTSPMFDPETLVK